MMQQVSSKPYHKPKTQHCNKTHKLLNHRHSKFHSIPQVDIVTVFLMYSMRLEMMLAQQYVIILYT